MSGDTAFDLSGKVSAKYTSCTFFNLPHPNKGGWGSFGIRAKSVTSMSEMLLRSMILAAIWMNAAHEALGSPETGQITGLI